MKLISDNPCTTPSPDSAFLPEGVSLAHVAQRIVLAFLAIAALAFALAGCGGGGGGGETITPPPPDSGTGADGVTIFWKHYGRAFGNGTAVQQTTDGGFIAVGQDSTDIATPSDIYVLKTDAQGNVQWQQWFGGSGRDIAQSVQQTADGGYIVAGCADCDANAIGFYLLKLDGSGNKLWDKTIAGASLSGAYAVRQTMSNGTPDGYILVGSDNTQGVALIKTDMSGNILWAKSFASAGWSVGFSVEQTSDGGYIIAGDAGVPTGTQLWLIKTDANGTETWDKLFGIGEAFSVKQTTDGGYVLAGRTTLRTFVAPASIVPGDAIVIKTDKDGNETWRKTLGGAEDDEAHSVTLTQDGGYVATGKTLSFGPGPVDYNYSYQWEDVFLFKLDANGNTVWEKVKGHRPNSSDGGYSVAATTDGGYIVTGNSNAYSSGGTVLLAKFDKNGDTVNLGDQDLTVSVPTTIGTINFTNAIEVATAGVQAVTLPQNVGATTLDLLIDVANAAPVSDFCDGGGSYTVPVLDPPAPIATGSELTVNFSDCVHGPITLTGPFTLRVDSLTGSLTTDTYTIQTTINPLDVTSSESGGTLTNTLSGGSRFYRQAVSGNYTEQSASITSPAPVTLTNSETQNSVTHTHVIGPFAISDSVVGAGTGAYSFGNVGEIANVDPGSSIGLLSVTIQQPVQGTAMGTAPTSGSFKIVAQDGSSMTVTIGASNITLAIDTNHDGTVDGTVTTTWEFVN
jgi:hypothetical protein